MKRNNIIVFSKAMFVLVLLSFAMQSCQHNYYRSKRRGGGKKGCGCPGGFSAERSTKDFKTNLESTNAFVFGNVNTARPTGVPIISQP